MSFDTLEQKLLSRRRMLLEQVARVEDDLRWLDTNVESEMTEEGQEETIARLLARLDDRGREEIDAIEAALARLEMGDYGRCTSCGASIPIARLEAMPTAELCVRCASARERPPT
jgi:RNA polymerase-binding transcription factor